MSMRMQTEVPGQEGCDPMRRCALTLHSTSGQDRKWLLANLEGSRLPELERLLRELQDLGIPSEPAMARAALKGIQSARGSADRPESTAVGACGRREAEARPPSAKALGQLLREEPIGLIVRVIAQKAPTEQKNVLAQIDAGKRRRVRRCLASIRTIGPGGGMAPRALQALEIQLSERLAKPSEPCQRRPYALGMIRYSLRILGFARGRS